jgi:hypothetical protein
VERLCPAFTPPRARADKVYRVPTPIWCFMCYSPRRSHTYIFNFINEALIRFCPLSERRRPMEGREVWDRFWMRQGERLAKQKACARPACRDTNWMIYNTSDTAGGRRRNRKWQVLKPSSVENQRKWEAIWCQHWEAIQKHCEAHKIGF